MIAPVCPRVFSHETPNVPMTRLFAAALFLLGLAACSDSALNDEDTVDFKNLKKVVKDEREIFMDPSGKLPYTGWAKSMYDEEQARYLAHCKDGLLDGKWNEWHRNGVKSQEGSYKAGLEDGSWTKWREDGSKESERSFKNGKEEGTWVEWHANGQKAEERTYSGGKLHGFWINWDESGEEWQRSSYKNGVAVED